MNVYDFSGKTPKGDKSLRDYEGKVLLIVNTASKCGFTPQFKELEDLYLKYKDPGTDAEIHEFCRLNYGVTFQVFGKGDVRGENAQPLFKWLTSQKGFKGFDESHPIAKILEGVLKEKLPEYLEGDGIKWNFTKFLIDREGNVVDRFEPTTVPSAIAPEIEKLL